MDANQLQKFTRYAELHSQALRIYFLFEDVPAAELLHLAHRLGEESTKLLLEKKIDWSACGHLGRHLTFLTRYLTLNEKQNCVQDIKDIINSDLPKLFNYLLFQPGDTREFDPVITTEIFPLLEGGHYDSAIRKVFVLISDRIRRKCGIQEQIDGEDLINRVFGGKSSILLKLEETNRQALRNLLSGFYGVFRNKFAHNVVCSDQSEVKAVIEMANAILIEIDAIQVG